MSKATAKKAAPKKDPIKPALKTVANTDVSTNKSVYAIESGVPVPAPTRSGGVSPYPFGQLKPGDCFSVPLDYDPDLYTTDDEKAVALAEERKTVSNRLSGAVARYKKRTGITAKFAIRTDETHGRVWLVEVTE